MTRWLAFCVFLGVGAFGLVNYGVPWLQARRIIDPFDAPADQFAHGNAIEQPRRSEAPIVGKVAEDKGTPHGFNISAACSLIATDRHEVPSEKDGVIVAIGAEIGPGEQIIADKLVTAKIGFLVIEIGAADPQEKVAPEQVVTFRNNTRKFRRWQEGDPILPVAMKVATEVRRFRRLEVGHEVKRDQIVALIDQTLAVRDLAIKTVKVEAAEAEKRSVTKFKEEFDRRYQAYLANPGAASKEDIRAAELQAQRYAQDEIAKSALIAQSQEELLQAIAILSKHEIRSAIDGVVKVIYKNRGDAVKSFEPILQLQSPKHLRAEALVEVQQARSLRIGMPVEIEPTQPESPQRILDGHQQRVNGVAVSRSPNSQVISCSEDRTVRIWDPRSGQQLFKIDFPGTAVNAIACSPASAKSNFLLAGCNNGTAWRLNLDRLDDAPLEFSERHQVAVTCVAFSTDGELCATGGEDSAICLWESSTGKLLYRLTQAHRGAVTSVQFSTKGQLVSAGRDHGLSVWNVGHSRTLTKVIDFDRRSGDVAQLGVSPDGDRVLFDYGKELRMLSLADRQIQGVLQNSGSTTNFTTMALFAPDGNTVLTNVAGEGRLQLWRWPSAVQPRAAELRQFICGPATCGAFAPDSSFAVTGTKDNRVLISRMPSKEEITKKLGARVSLVENELQNASRQVRVWAELENPGWLTPGGSATMVIFQESAR